MVNVAILNIQKCNPEDSQSFYINTAASIDSPPSPARRPSPRPRHQPSPVQRQTARSRKPFPAPRPLRAVNDRSRRRVAQRIIATSIGEPSSTVNSADLDGTPMRCVGRHAIADRRQLRQPSRSTRRQKSL